MKYQVWFKWEDPDIPPASGDFEGPLNGIEYDTRQEAEERIELQFSDGRYHAEEYYVKEIKSVSGGNEASITGDGKMNRGYEVGQHVIYVDSVGKPHKALVTVWWGMDENGARYPYYAEGELGCNVVVISDDELKKDDYGRQIERYTSVVHKSKQAAPAYYWCWPDEL
jgi:hypothetical protein